jgi:uncharacterized membrane protein
MNIVLWIVQALLVIVFFMAGIMKLTQPREKMVEKMPWVSDFSAGQIRLIGIFEIAGALGLAFLALTGILPWLTALVAFGLALLMVGAAFTHLRRKEYTSIIMNVILMLAAVFVAFAWFSAIPA